MRLIDADALLNGGIRVEFGYNNDGLILVPMRDVRKSINDAPTIEPFKWYSVFDQVPSEDGNYIICTENNAVCTAHYYSKSNEFSGPAGRHATHWTFLPPAPKEEQ